MLSLAFDVLKVSVAFPLCEDFRTGNFKWTEPQGLHHLEHSLRALLLGTYTTQKSPASSPAHPVKLIRVNDCLFLLEKEVSWESAEDLEVRGVSWCACAEGGPVSGVFPPLQGTVYLKNNSSFIQQFKLQLKHCVSTATQLQNLQTTVKNIFKVTQE